MSDYYVRWMVRKDTDAVLDIDYYAQSLAWLYPDWIAVLRKRDNICMVAEDENHVVRGYILYSLRKTSLTVIRFGVDQSYLRRGVATELIRKLKAKLSMQRRHSILVKTRDDQLAGHLFLKSEGFTCIGTNDDVYLFRFTLLGEKCPSPQESEVVG